MPENRTSGSVWGVLGNRYPYHNYFDHHFDHLQRCSDPGVWMNSGDLTGFPSSLLQEDRTWCIDSHISFFW